MAGIPLLLGVGFVGLVLGSSGVLAAGKFGNTSAGDSVDERDILTPPANHLDTEPSASRVTEATREISEAIETITANIENPHDYDIKMTSSLSHQSVAIADAVEKDALHISPAEQQSPAESTAEPDLQAVNGQTESSEGEEEIQIPQQSLDNLTTLTEAVEDVKFQANIQSATASKLLDNLDTQGTIQQDQLRDSLVEAIDSLNEFHQLKSVLVDIPTSKEPEEMANIVQNRFSQVDIDGAENITTVAELFEETVKNLRACEQQQDVESEYITKLCEIATDQTSISLDSGGRNSRSDSLERLVTVIERGDVWFVDNASNIANLIADVESSKKAQSSIAQELLDILRSPKSADDQRFMQTLEKAITAIDQAETVNSRLKGVEPDAVDRTADRLLSELESHSETVIPHLRERVTDIQEIAERANEDDLLTLYAARQELRYYDRTLIPQLDSSTTHQTEEKSESDTAIAEIDDRRSQMRQSYPSEFPDCDHTIPIYFFDMVSELLDIAEEHENNGEYKQAEGVAMAAEKALDWIQGLYETHSYFVLLKQLRG